MGFRGQPSNIRQSTTWGVFNVRGVGGVEIRGRELHPQGCTKDQNHIEGLGFRVQDS